MSFQSFGSSTTGAVTAGPQRRYLTVVFYDLIGSTALCDQVEIEDLFEIMRAFHSTVTRVMKAWGGFAARYMGDGGLAYFGYPQSDERHAERAVLAALHSIEDIAGLRLPGGRVLHMRIGVSSGQVIVGDVIGTGTSLGLDVAGATPNVAARLQTLAAPDSVYVSDDTRRLAGDNFRWQDLGPMIAKGFACPIRTWRASAAREVSSRRPQACSIA
jgi:class 3 adenylate cyclase